MDKEYVVYIYNGLLLSHKNNKIMQLSRSLSQLPITIGRDWDTEWSESDRERQIYDITYLE